MKMALVALAAVCVLPVSAVAAGRASGTLSVTGSGEPRWRISCEVVDIRGNVARPEITGRAKGDRKTVTRSGLDSANCTYQASAQAPLEIQFNDKDFACPFPEAQGGQCARTVEAGGHGAFMARLKR